MNLFSNLASTPILSATSKSAACRLTAITAFVLLLALPALAQRGGGGATGARAGAFANGVGVAGGHVGGGGRVGIGTSTNAAPGRPGSSAHPSHHPSGGPSHSHGSNDRFQTWYFGKNRFPNCWGYGCWNWAYPWGAYYPYWGSGYDPYYAHQYDHDDNSADALDRERLEDAQTAPPWGGYGYPYPYMPPPPTTRRPTASEPQGTPIIPPTVLVFRDRHKQEVQSYAIVRETLWNFTTPQHIEKISLADLDLSATVKANNERGVSFRIPTQRSTSDNPPAPSNT